MPVPLVVVELPEINIPAPEAAALVQACSSALRAGRCELTGDSQSPEATAIAVVSFRGGERLRALVEVGKRRKDAQSWLSEELVFQIQDPANERFRTIGLTIASLLHEIGEGGPSKPSSDSPERAEGMATQPGTQSRSRGAPVDRVDSAAQARARAERKARNEREGARSDGTSDEPSDGTSDQRTATDRVRRLGWVAIGGLARSDQELGALRLGGQLTLFSAPLKWPLLVSFSARYLVAEASGVRWSWLSAGVGVGGFWTVHAAFSLRARLDAVAENAAAVADDETGEMSQRKQLWLGGMRASLDWVWPIQGFLGLSLSVDGEHMGRAVAVTLYRQPVGTASAFSYGAGIALEFYPFGR